MGGFSGLTAVIALLAISLSSFVLGSFFRKWPEKVQEYVEPFDGSMHLLSPEAHRAMTRASGLALWLLSMAALIAAGLTL